MMAAKTGLQSLPTELLLIIFENPEFPIEALYNMCLISKSIHSVALPVYLRRFGIDLSDTARLDLRPPDTRLDALSGLSLAFSIRGSVNSVQFHGTHSFNADPPSSRQLRRMRAFVSELNAVEDVSMQLVGSRDNWTPWDTSYINRNSIGLAEDLVEFLNVCIQLPKLRTLDVSLDYWDEKEMSDAIHMRETSSPLSLLGTGSISALLPIDLSPAISSPIEEHYTYALQRCGLVENANHQELVLGSMNIPSPSITSFSVTEHFVYYTPIAYWTLSFLYTSTSIVELVFTGGWSFTGPTVTPLWTAFLRCIPIALPKLKRLIFPPLLAHFPLHTIGELIDNLPHLTLLDVGYPRPADNFRQATFSPTEIPFKPNRLLFLSTLRAPYALIIQLLTRHPKSTVLPLLKHLTVLTDDLDLGVVGILEMLQHVYVCLKSNNLSPSLSFQLCYRSAMSMMWLLNDLSRYDGLTQSDISLQAPEYAATDMRIQEPIARMIETVYFSGIETPTMQFECHRHPKWLKFFPSLKKVEFKVCDWRLRGSRRIVDMVQEIFEENESVEDVVFGNVLCRRTHWVQVDREVLERACMRNW